MKKAPVAALLAGLGLLLVPILAPGPAAASPILELVGGLGGGGFNARVVGVGPDATYFNPSLLPDQANSVDVFIFGIGNTLSIDVNDRPAGVDLSDSIYDAWLSDGAGGVSPLENPPLATGDLYPRQDNDGLTDFQSYAAFWRGQIDSGRKAGIRLLRRRPDRQDPEPQRVLQRRARAVLLQQPAL